MLRFPYMWENPSEKFLIILIGTDKGLLDPFPGPIYSKKNTFHLIKQYLCGIKGLQSDQSMAIIWLNHVPQSSKSSKGSNVCSYSKEGSLC